MYKNVLNINNKGFSLVGILVASTIGTVLVLGLASSQVNLAKWQRKISTKNKVNWLETRMQSVMSSSTDQVTCLKNLEEQIKGYDFSAPKFCLARDTTPTNTKTIETILTDILTCANRDVNSCGTSLCIWSPDIRAETHIIAFAESSSQSFNGERVVEVEGVSQCCFDADGECPLGSTDDLACYDVPMEGKPDFGKTKVGCEGTVITSKPTLFGFNAGKVNTGNNNTFIGNEAGTSNTTATGNTFIGNVAGWSNTIGNSNTFMGSSAGTSNTKGRYNTFIGSWAGRSNTTGRYNTFMGNSAGHDNTGDGNTFIGYEAGYKNKSAENTFIGSYAGKANIAGSFNTFIGSYAGKANIAGDLNTFMGDSAGHDNTTGHSNTFMGSYAGRNNTRGHQNTFIGTTAGVSNTEAGGNTFIGYEAGRYSISGYNTFIGYEAGSSHKSGGYNIYLGNEAGCYKHSSDYRCTGDNNIFIGATYTPTSATDPLTNELNIGNLITGEGVVAGSALPILTTYGSSQAKKKVTIHGDLEVKGNISATGTITPPPSDRRLKKQIKPLEHSLSKLMKLSPKTYYWKDKKRGTKKQFGLIAQEVRTEYPEVVSEDSTKKKMLSLNYISFIPILISSLKEMYAFVKSEFKEIKVSLLKEVTELKTSLLNLKKELKTSLLNLKKELKTQNKETKRSLSNLGKKNEQLTKQIAQIKEDNKKLVKRLKRLEDLTPPPPRSIS